MAKSKEVLSQAQTLALLQQWLQSMFTGLSSLTCQKCSGLSTKARDDARNELVKAGLLELTQSGIAGSTTVSSQCTPELVAGLLASPDGQAFFKSLLKTYSQQHQTASYYSYDTSVFQMNMIAGMLLGEDCSEYLIANLARYRDWLDQYTGRGTSQIEQFLDTTIFNTSFLAKGIASPRVAAVLLARLGYRLFEDGCAEILRKYFDILSADRNSWAEFLKSDKLAASRVHLCCIFYLCGRLDYYGILKPSLPQGWSEVFDALVRGDANAALGTLRKLLEALPIVWQDQLPKPMMLFAVLMQFILLIGLRSGKAAILQTERLLSQSTECFANNGELWLTVKQEPFPKADFTWSGDTEKVFDAAPLENAMQVFLAATLLHDTAQHLVPPDFWRFALKSYKYFLDAGFALLAYYLQNIMQSYLPENEQWQGTAELELPVAPIFLPERKRSEEEIFVGELSKILTDARDRKSKDDGGDELKTFGFQITLRQIGEKSGYFQVDSATPCIVTRSKRGLVRIKKVALSRVKRGQYDQIMDRVDHVVANMIQEDKAASDDDATAGALHLNSETASVLETPRKFFLKGETTPLLMKIEPLRLSLEVNESSFAIKLPQALPEGLDDPYFMQKSGKGSYTVTPIDGEVKKLFELLHKWGKDGQRKIRLSGKMRKKVQDLIPAFSQISPYLQIFGTGSAISDVAGGSIAGEVNLELRISTAPDGAWSVEMFCHPVPNDPSFEIKPGADAMGVLHNTGDEAVTVERDLRRERFEADRVINACPSLDPHPSKPYSWLFTERGSLLRFVAEFERMNDPSIKMTFPENNAWSVSKLNQPLELKHVGGTSRGWFEIGAEIRVDENRVLRLMDLLALAKSRQGNFIDLGDNKYMEVSDATLRQLELLDLYRGRSKESVQIPQGFVPALIDLQEASGGKTPQELEKIRDDFANRLSETPSLPKGIDVALRPYQAEGYRWLMQHYACEFGGCCLADDMGLGKTIQLLVFLKAVVQKGPSLVVVPTSLAGNWCSEGMRFTPTLNIINFAAERDLELDKLQAEDVVIVSYGLLANEIERFEKTEWNVAVLDEAQAIKNASALRTGAAKRLNASFRIVATGTPIENNLSEFWSLFDFALPGLLGTKVRFKELFEEEGEGSEGRTALRRLVSPFILRRLKRDVLQDLPPKTEILVPVELSDDERAQYESIRRAAVERITDPTDRISILASLMRLRRTCCHPSLVAGEWTQEGAKIEKLMELADNLKRNGHRALVFSQFVDMLTVVRKAFDKAGHTYQYLDGATLPKERNAAVAAFQGGSGDFFLISLKAGGTGLNLTAADYVIILDPWWNPAVESQAADRAHRIGQRRPVTIYRLVTKDTVEEKVIALHAVKQRLVEDMLADSGNSTLTPDELMSLFK